jgi:hypothetical protein
MIRGDSPTGRWSGNLDKILPRATPESVGIPSAAVIALVDELERSAHDVHSLMIVRRGYAAAEGWRTPNRPEYPQMQRATSYLRSCRSPRARS